MVRKYHELKQKQGRYKACRREYKNEKNKEVVVLRDIKYTKIVLEREIALKCNLSRMKIGKSTLYYGRILEKKFRSLGDGKLDIVIIKWRWKIISETRKVSWKLDGRTCTVNLREWEYFKWINRSWCYITSHKSLRNPPVWVVKIVPSKPIKMRYWKNL